MCDGRLYRAVVIAVPGVVRGAATELIRTLSALPGCGFGTAAVQCAPVRSAGGRERDGQVLRRNKLPVAAVVGVEAALPATGRAEGHSCSPRERLALVVYQVGEGTFRGLGVRIMQKECH